MLVAAVGAVIAFANGHADARQRQATAQSRHDRLEARSRATEPRRTPVVPDAQALADLRRANAIIDQLTVPWDALFDAVEAADARGLGVLSLTPNAREHTVRLAGESRSMNELLAYLERLAAQPALGQAHLLGYSTAQRDGVELVSFSLAATWRLRP
ncbi:MAG: PilN domain-containing protein [Pseudomonadota bacterium]